jgi:hypothetical protein
MGQAEAETGEPVPLLPLEARRAIRTEALSHFRRYARALFQLRPEYHSIGFQVRRPWLSEGIEYGLRFSREATPPLEECKCQGGNACHECEVWDDFLEWTAWLHDWNARPGHAEAFLAYCPHGTYATYAIARRGKVYDSEVAVEVLATIVQPWFEPDDAVAQVPPVAAELRPFYAAVHASPNSVAAKRALGEQLQSFGLAHGRYVLEQLGRSGLDHGEQSLLGTHWAQWLGALRVAVGREGLAFAEGFPCAVEACFTNHPASTACAQDPAWACVEQLELLDPRELALRPGVSIEDVQPITAAMSSLQMISGVRSSGLSSLANLQARLPAWSLAAKLCSVQDLETLLRIRCLPELTDLDLDVALAWVPEPTAWERLWGEAPWGRTLKRLRVSVRDHLATWSRRRARPRTELHYHEPEVGILYLQADEAGSFTQARCLYWSGTLEPWLLRLADLPPLAALQMEPSPRGSVAGRPRPLPSEEQKLAFVRAVAERHPGVQIVFGAPR